MSESDRKPPAFFCPACGQKHRADLTPFKKHGGQGLVATCRNCGAKLRVRLEETGPVSELIEAPAQPAAARPATQSAPVVVPGGPYEEEIASPLESGDKAGRYTVKGKLSQGRTAVVYQVDDPTTKRSVALKVLRADANDAVAEQFRRQVEVQANIRHPNIMPVYDRGTLEDGRPYFTAELLHRPAALVDVLERRQQGKLTTDKALASFAELRALVERVIVPVADGIYVANIENGVVHGDLRPENVLIDRRTQRPYLLDFGNSHELVEGRARTTVPLSHYVSPEQARGWVYPRTDVWGLGALLFACLTGNAPLEGRGDELRQRALAGQYRPLGAEAPPDLAAIVRKAMASETDARYVNARQMATDLRAWLKGGRVRAVEEFGCADATAQETKRQVKQHLRSAAWIAAGLVVGLLVGSQIRLGGEDPGDVRIRTVEAEVDQLDADVSRLAPTAPTLPLAGAAEVWLGLERRWTKLASRLDKAPPSGARQSVAAQLAFVRERFAPLPVTIDAPTGLRIEAVNTTSGRPYALEPGVAYLPPGRYQVEIGEGNAAARFQARVPLALRPTGQEARAKVPCARWGIPLDPATLPKDRALVVGCAVRLGGPPRAADGNVVDVPSFAIDRRPVTNEQYAAFVNSLPQAERGAHGPRVGFEEVRGIWRPVTGMVNEPVAAITVADARAYCAWRSKEEGVTVRLPNAAERRLVAGVSVADLADGDLREAPKKNPYGVRGLGGPRREMVTSLDGAQVFAVPADGTLPQTPLAVDARDESTGFRCVQQL